MAALATTPTKPMDRPNPAAPVPHPAQLSETTPDKVLKKQALEPRALFQSPKTPTLEASSMFLGHDMYVMFVASTWLLRCVWEVVPENSGLQVDGTGSTDDTADVAALKKKLEMLVRQNYEKDMENRNLRAELSQATEQLEELRQQAGESLDEGPQESSEVSEAAAKKRLWRLCQKRKNGIPASNC